MLKVEMDKKVLIFDEYRDIVDYLKSRDFSQPLSNLEYKMRVRKRVRIFYSNKENIHVIRDREFVMDLLRLGYITSIEDLELLERYETAGEYHA